MVLTTTETWTLRGAESFRVIEHADFKRVTIRFPDSYAEKVRTFANLQKALHTLGGCVPWESWSPETQEILRAVNNGKAI